MKTKLGLILLLSCFLPVKLDACTCEGEKSVKDYFEASNQIFIGKVIGVNSNWISGGMKYTFAVEQTWKRGADSLLVVNTGWDYECGYQFEEGKRYLVYGLKKFSLRTDACMGNKPLDEAGQDLEYLGIGDWPRKSKVVPIVGWGMGLMVLLAMAFLAFVIFRKKGSSHNSI